MVREVESEIARRLKAKYLQDPQVLAPVKDAVGLRVAVQGAVRSPGVVQIRGDTTLTNVIAQAQASPTRRINPRWLFEYRSRAHSRQGGHRAHPR